MNRRGAILILTFIVMAAIIAVTAAFLYMTSFLTKGRGYDIASAKALWIAEGGLNKYFLLLKNGTYNNVTHPDLNENLGSGSYLVTASYDTPTTTYTLTSTGTVGSISRKIRRTAVETSAVLERAIHADGAHVKFDGSTGGYVYGNISAATSVLDEDDLANYLDFVNGVYTITDNSSTPPQDKINPTMNYATYLALAQADDNPPGDVHVATGTGSAGVLTIGAGAHDGVYYATEGINIQDGAVIYGSVISKKSVDFPNGPITVTIKPELSTRAIADGNNYAAIVCSQGGIQSTGIGGSKIGLQNSTINGLVMCSHSGSAILFQYLKNTTFNGTIIAANNIELTLASAADGQGFTVTYDASIFSPMIQGFGYTPSGETTVMLQKDWHEIVPAT